MKKGLTISPIMSCFYGTNLLCLSTIGSFSQNLQIKRARIPKRNWKAPGSGYTHPHAPGCINLDNVRHPSYRALLSIPNMGRTCTCYMSVEIIICKVANYKLELGFAIPLQCMSVVYDCIDQFGVSLIKCEVARLPRYLVSTQTVCYTEYMV